MFPQDRMEMRIEWKRKNNCWFLFVDDKKVGCVIYDDGGAFEMRSTIIFNNRMHEKSYPTISGARMRLEQLAGIESDWARQRRANMV
jgi:hypothetical protein